mgnify:CR=1 FL=1|tara:strand:- start:379 stop:669 length:291 start_codon:yes stop_codon:yes gene_type:complete|eukprot:COSAG06_NODE_11977_length_1440_cov_1.061148_2_plen_97_part_00
MIKVEIKKSSNPKKKFMAIFYDGKKKIKTTHFGSNGMSDYTIHKDKTRRQRYLDRHRKRENWNAYMTAGSLSRWILWNLPTLKGSINDYKKRFKLL